MGPGNSGSRRGAVQTPPSWTHVSNSWTELSAGSPDVYVVVPAPSSAKAWTVVRVVGQLVVASVVSPSSPLNVRAACYPLPESGAAQVWDLYSESNYDKRDCLWFFEDWLQPWGPDLHDVVRVPIDIRTRRRLRTQGGQNPAGSLIFHVATNSSLSPSIGCGIALRSLWRP